MSDVNADNPEINDPVDEQTPDVQKLQEERDDLYNRLARATAEFKNSQKRMQVEFDQQLQYANASLIKNLIPVIDNFERALAQDAESSDVPAILKGMQIVHDQWLSVLKKEEVEEIAPQEGDTFDPTRHEALLHQASDKYNEPTVTQLLQKGYALHGRTLRPAKVAVSKPN
jgi:molecular chaperone GrpE